MEKNLEGKRERNEEEEEEEDSEDIPLGELYEKTIYLNKAKKRINEKSEHAPPPPGRGLIEFCIIFNGARIAKYGVIKFNGKMERVHRVALMIALGVFSLPKKNANGEAVECAHKCDNPLCCEPTHLYLATKAENGADRTKNGLMRGEKNPNGNTKEEIARAIKLSKGEGSKQERAIRFGVTKSVVKNIDQGVSWAHLPDANGNTHEKKRAERNKNRSIARELARENEWTKEQLDEAQVKFNDPNYVKIDMEHTYPEENGTPCHLWIRATLDVGYPATTINRQTVGGHIVACTIGNNYIRPDNLEAAHECGQMLCVNSKHLTFKTHTENMRDKYKHGTIQLKLSFKQVADIREQYANGKTVGFLAEAYGVANPTISNIVNNLSRTIG